MGCHWNGNQPRPIVWTSYRCKLLGWTLGLLGRPFAFGSTQWFVLRHHSEPGSHCGYEAIKERVNVMISPTLTSPPSIHLSRHGNLIHIHLYCKSKLRKFITQK